MVYTLMSPIIFCLEGQAERKGWTTLAKMKTGYAEENQERSLQQIRAGDVERLEFVKVHVKWHEPLGKGLG